MFFKRKKINPHLELFDTIIEQLKGLKSRNYPTKLSDLEVHGRVLTMSLDDRAAFLVEFMQCKNK